MAGYAIGFFWSTLWAALSSNCVGNKDTFGHLLLVSDHSGLRCVLLGRVMSQKGMRVCMKSRSTCPLRRLISFLELVFEPTTSGRANVLSIWSAIVSPPPILNSVSSADEAVFSIEDNAASEHGYVTEVAGAQVWTRVDSGEQYRGGREIISDAKFGDERRQHLDGI